MNWNFLDWSDLVVRWFHVTAAISWIGASLYLMWFDRIFATPDRTSRGERGEPWLIDFASSQLAGKLGRDTAEASKAHRWLKREPALTLSSGVLLLGIVTLIPGRSILFDAAGAPIGALAGVLIVVAILGLSWPLYDFFYRSPIARKPRAANVIASACFVCVTWGLSQFLDGRAVFLLIGAMLGTLMTFNVWWRLLPALKEMSDARLAGRTVDVGICALARERGAHNAYLIFPVVVLMLSNHYPVIYSSSLGWLVLCLIVSALIGVRYMVEGNSRGKVAFLCGLAAVGVAMYIVAARPLEPASENPDRVSFAAVRDIVNQRCVACHSATPSDRSFGPAPGGVDFDTPENIAKHAQRIKIRAVDSLTMPIGPNSGMSRTERELIGRWVHEGAMRK
ncbi:MAG: urate hydroxylase PuuD [Burkholderiaceae bacterium]|nr:urate hydroxylase PuuD [Burkholderiaceae bacterium]